MNGPCEQGATLSILPLHLVPPLPTAQENPFISPEGAHSSPCKTRQSSYPKPDKSVLFWGFFYLRAQCGHCLEPHARVSSQYPSRTRCMSASCGLSSSPITPDTSTPHCSSAPKAVRWKQSSYCNLDDGGPGRMGGGFRFVLREQRKYMSVIVKRHNRTGEQLLYFHSYFKTSIKPLAICLQCQQKDEDFHAVQHN